MKKTVLLTALSASILLTGCYAIHQDTQSLSPYPIILCPKTITCDRNNHCLSPNPTMWQLNFQVRNPARSAYTYYFSKSWEYNFYEATSDNVEGSHAFCNYRDSDSRRVAELISTSSKLMPAITQPRNQWWYIPVPSCTSEDNEDPKECPFILPLGD